MFVEMYYVELNSMYTDVQDFNGFNCKTKQLNLVVIIILTTRCHPCINYILYRSELEKDFTCSLFELCDTCTVKSISL